jgi:hypothetical protein
MLIRYGYEITLNCARPTALVCLLSVHDDHAKAIRVPERVFTTPIIPTTTYRDPFGNKCLRLVAPTGDLTLWGDATIEDSGRPRSPFLTRGRLLPPTCPMNASSISWAADIAKPTD